MKIKEIYVEAKKSWAFQTYTVGITAEVGEGEDAMSRIRQVQAECRKLAQEQIDVDKGKLK